MSTKGNSLSIITKHKIKLANEKDRSILLSKINEYLEQLGEGDLPQIVSASLYAGISEKALLAYESRTEENSEIRILLDNLRDRQKEWLIKNGIFKKTDSKLTGLLLSKDHGIKDDPQSLTQNNNFNISPELLADALAVVRTEKKS